MRRRIKLDSAKIYLEHRASKCSKKIELIVDYKEGNSDYLILKAIIDGTVVATLDNNIMDCYATGDDSKYPGQTLHVRLHGNGCYTVKSIDWEPAE